MIIYHVSRVVFFTVRTGGRQLTDSFLNSCSEWLGTLALVRKCLKYHTVNSWLTFGEASNATGKNNTHQGFECKDFD